MVIYPKVSILLTSYNNEMVRDTIQSVIDQTYKNWELIILDDNSNQKILDIYKEFSDPRITIWNSHIKEKDRLKESPYARNINEGLKMATGKLVVYLCDDVVYLPHKLKTMVKFLRWHPRVKVCYNRQSIEYSKEIISHAIKNTKDKRLKEFLTKKKLPPVKILAPDRILKNAFCRVDHNSVMHYMSCIDEVGNWDTDSFAMADAYFWNKLTTKYLFYPIREVLEIHYSHEGSFSSKIMTKKIYEKNPIRGRCL